MIRLSICILAAAAVLYPADKPNREIQELQRDVAQLQEIVKTLQRSLEERISGLGVQVQGAADAAGKAGAAVSAVQRSVDQVALDQERKLGPPIATLGGRMEQISGALGTMQQAVSDLTAVVNKLQAQIGDLTNAVKVINEPRPAPPGPPMGATELWSNAERDRGSGKYDLALQEYADYIKWYPETPQASTAQYYVGWIHYSLKDYGNALQDFDALLAKYPDSAKAPDALFYKAKTLAGLGRGSEAAGTYKELRKLFPNHSLVSQIPR